MFDKKFSFDGSFQPDCQKDAVLPSPLALLNMILERVNMKHQTELVKATTMIWNISQPTSITHTHTHTVAWIVEYQCVI